MYVNALWFRAISRLDGKLRSGGIISLVRRTIMRHFSRLLMGLHIVLQKNTNWYACGIRLAARCHYRNSLFGLGFPHFRASSFEIFDTQDYCQGGLASRFR
jgi:hypothetical protein